MKLQDNNISHNILDHQNTSQHLPALPTTTMYKVMEGSRAGSCIYVHENFTYTLFREYNSHYRVRCTEWRKKSCKAFANISKIDDSFVLSKVHCHEGNEANIAMLRLKSGMKREAASTTTSLREIFDRACEGAELESNDLSFTKMESTLYKRRRRTQCFIPSMAQGIKEEEDDGGGGENGSYEDDSYCYSQSRTCDSLTNSSYHNDRDDLISKNARRRYSDGDCNEGAYSVQSTFQDGERTVEHREPYGYAENDKDFFTTDNQIRDYRETSDEDCGSKSGVHQNNYYHKNDNIDHIYPSDYHQTYLRDSNDDIVKNHENDFEDSSRGDATHLDKSEDYYGRKNNLADYEEAPLLYTQGDLDEVIKAREDEWTQRQDELERKIKEEIAMRELLEEDHRSKMETLKKQNSDMKMVVAQYEKTIMELTEQSRQAPAVDEDMLSETVRAKEQLTQDLNQAEQNLVDAYKRIEKLKIATDTYKQNEGNLKNTVKDYEVKLQKSEERYNKLKQHASEKIDAANVEIERVRKQKEIDLAGIQASLKKATNRVGNLEVEIAQKTNENKELSQICDELIKKVSGD